MSSGLLWRGSVSLVVGRLSLSAGRLLICAIVARLSGVQALGDLVLLLSLIAIAEWLADFGQADISVREIGKGTVEQASALSALRRAKLTNGLIAALTPAAGMLALGHWPLLGAGLIAGAGILAFAGLQTARVAARSALRPDRDVAAEVAGFLCWLALAWPATRFASPLEALAGGYALSRIVHWAVLVRIQPAPRRSAPGHAARTLILSAAPLGIIGLLVAVYDNVAPILLALLGDPTAVAQYGVAARFAFPALIVVQAINQAFFPMLASAGENLADVQQWPLETSLAVAGLIFVAVHGAAGFLFALVSPELPPATLLLKLLAWLVLIKTVTSCLSALVVVAGRQLQAMWLGILALAIQTAAILVLVPRWGVASAAWSYILLELLLGVLPVAWLARRATGSLPRPGRPLLLIAAPGLIAAISDRTPIAGTLAAGIVSALVFALLVPLICPHGLDSLRSLLRARAARAAS